MSNGYVAAQDRHWRAGISVAASVHLLALLILAISPLLDSRLGMLRVGAALVDNVVTVPAGDQVEAGQAEESVRLTAGEPATPDIGTFVRSRIEEEASDNQGLDEDAKLDKLSSLSQRLTETSSEQSLNQLSSSLKRWLGTDSRAERPAEAPVEGDFDFHTAQLHDVRREETDDGHMRYISILIDAEGRQMEAALTEAEGEQLYRVMELIKNNPLLEKVYRQLVMSFLDKLMRPQDASSNDSAGTDPSK